jgi:hypothetical protein
MRERVTFGIATGCSTTYLRMSTAEVQRLVDALQWSLAQAPQPEAVPA